MSFLTNISVLKFSKLDLILAPYISLGAPTFLLTKIIFLSSGFSFMKTPTKELLVLGFPSYLRVPIQNVVVLCMLGKHCSVKVLKNELP